MKSMYIGSMTKWSDWKLDDSKEIKWMYGVRNKVENYLTEVCLKNPESNLDVFFRIFFISLPITGSGMISENKMIKAKVISVLSVAFFPVLVLASINIWCAFLLVPVSLSTKRRILSVRQRKIVYDSKRVKE